MVIKHKILFRETPFSIDQGPDLPIPMAGHCQVHIGNNSVLIYGGVTSLNSSGFSYAGFQIKEYSNLAWTWNSIASHWTAVPTESPCPSSRLPPVIMQPCSMKGSSQVVILHQDFEHFPLALAY